MTREPLRPFLSNVMRLLNHLQFPQKRRIQQGETHDGRFTVHSAQWCLTIPHRLTVRYSSTISITPVLLGPTPQTGVNLPWLDLATTPVGILHSVEPAGLGGATSPAEVPDD